MQIGDLVTVGGRLLLDDTDVEWLGIVIKEEPLQGRLIVHWNDGRAESMPVSCLEIVCK
jgi:hypothetical protein